MRTATSRSFFERARLLFLVALCPLAVQCGGGGDGDGVEWTSVSGKVIDGPVGGAVVCLDANRNGRCDRWEAQTISDASGRYELAIPADAEAPLIAEIEAGVASESEPPGAAVDVSFRMGSPARAYSTTITPFTTLVLLTGERNFALAEDLVRNELGLPPKFDIAMSAAPAAGSLQRAVAEAIVVALKRAGVALGPAGEGVWAQVVAAFPSSLTDLPQLRIATKNGAPIDSKEIYVDATFQLTNPALSAQPFDLNGKIRGRGHTTWGLPKNPYKVQFSNDAAYAKVPDVLGMPKNRNWALLADYFDRSLIRNKLALSLASSAVFSDGMKWAPSGQHVEVWLNDDYVGVYLLTEDIRIDPVRLNLKKMSSSAAGNDTDGGYIVEVDARLDCYKGDDVDLQLILPHGASICIDTPDEGAITPAQLAYVKDLLMQVEQDLYGAHRIDRINPASFADWYLLQELFRNVDANFLSSDFMWKDTETAANPQDRKLNMGPVWDFDRGAGNANYFAAWQTAGCWVNQPDFERGIGSGNWYSTIFDNPEFLALTLDRWRLKRSLLARFVDASVATYSRRLEQAQQRNFARWPIFGTVLTNYYTFSNYADEVAFLKRYLNERMLWLDQAYESPQSFVAMCK